MSKSMINATLSAILALGISGVVAEATADVASKDMKNLKMMKGLEKCYGVAKAGMNDCSYAKQSCAGSSTVDSDKAAWIELPKGTCNKIVGGSNQAPADSKTP